MIISIIVAFAENNVIGKDNQMPWKLSDDLKRFKAITTGHTVVMGRKTFESLGKPLPNRKNIVLTSNPAAVPTNVITAGSLQQAIALAEPESELFIIGGGDVYRQALPIADRLYLTKVHTDIEGDTYFPEINYAEWRETFREEHPADEKNQYGYTFINYEKKKTDR